MESRWLICTLSLTHAYQNNPLSKRSINAHEKICAFDNFLQKKLCLCVDKSNTTTRISHKANWPFNPSSSRWAWMCLISGILTGKSDKKRSIIEILHRNIRLWERSRWSRSVSTLILPWFFGSQYLSEDKRMFSFHLSFCSLLTTVYLLIQLHLWKLFFANILNHLLDSPLIFFSSYSASRTQYSTDYHTDIDLKVLKITPCVTNRGSLNCPNRLDEMMAAEWAQFSNSHWL